MFSVLILRTSLFILFPGVSLPSIEGGYAPTGIGLPVRDTLLSTSLRGVDAPYEWAKGGAAGVFRLPSPPVSLAAEIRGTFSFLSEGGYAPIGTRVRVLVSLPTERRDVTLACDGDGGYAPGYTGGALPSSIKSTCCDGFVSTM